MPVLIGILFGRAVGLLLGRVMLSHAVLTVAVWYGLSAVAFWLARQNLGTSAGIAAAAAAPAALLAWTLHRPAESRAKLWLFDGFYVWTRLGIAWAAVVSVVRLVADDGSLVRWPVDAWPFLLAGLGCWLLRRLLVSLLRRSHVRAGDCSLID